MRSKITPIVLLILMILLIFYSLIDGVESENHHFVLMSIRLPKLILAFSVGAILAQSGLFYQSIFQNNLASPYTLGTSMVASFVAVLLLAFEIQSGLSLSLSVFLGGSLSYFLLHLFSRLIGRNRRDGLLLSGIAQSLLFSSLIIFIQVYSTPYINQRVIHWMVGSLNTVGWKEPLILLSTAFILLAFALTHWHKLEVLSLGDEFAYSRGVIPDQIRSRTIAIVCVAIALVVGIAGPIGFVGLLIPNFVRLFFKNKMIVWPMLNFVTGGLFLVSCDLFVRILFPMRELPIGVITSLIGAPLFIFLLSRKSQ